MKMIEIVRKLDLGSSVAEFDEALEKYFVETEAFKAVVSGRFDIIAGDKGTGKTAMYRILERRHRSIPELDNVEIVTGFNPSGNPVFQRLVQEAPLTEGQYRSVWKAYIFSLIGNWALEVAGNSSPRFERLDKILTDTSLRSQDDTPSTVFSRLVNAIRNYLHPKSIGAEFTFSETGIPIITPKFELGEVAQAKTAEVPHEDALRLLNECVSELGVEVWLVLDRLDEAFQGFQNVEIPALRALMRTYLDLLEFRHIRLKIFVRRDLFRRIIGSGFVNLTHLNARKIEIIWDEDDLRNLICRRMRESGDFLDALSVRDNTDVEVFDRVFPRQVDVGERKPTCWNWIMARIRDGNDLKPPRNLIDLIAKARESQLRREEREAREFQAELPVIEAESIRRAHSRLSEERVEDTLLAEAGEAAPLVQKFRGAKSEHNLSTLSTLFGEPIDNVPSVIKPLEDIGFLEQFGQSYKVPMLYRDGLQIVQGKAF
jgi:hypothetical protein